MKLIVLVIILILTSITNRIVNSVIIDINEDAGSDINEVTENNYDSVGNIIYTSNINRSYENKLPSLPKILKKGIISDHKLTTSSSHYYNKSND